MRGVTEGETAGRQSCVDSVSTGVLKMDLKCPHVVCIHSTMVDKKSL